MAITISVGEMRRVLREKSESEFKPLVFGDKESKKTNEKAYSDMMKDTEAYNGGITKNGKADVSNSFKGDNKGMHDLRYDSISEPFIEKAKANMKGYPSKQAYDLHKGEELGNARYGEDSDFYDGAKEHAKEMKAGKDKAAEIGLTSRELSKKDIEDNDKTMYESRKIKVCKFKQRFVNEEHMLGMVPDEKKVDGNRFVMKDNCGNEYLVEWSSMEPKVTKRVNMRLVNEEKERIKALWGYKSSEAHKSTSEERLSEDNAFKGMVDKARKLLD
jgi:hypothetical protein